MFDTSTPYVVRIFCTSASSVSSSWKSERLDSSEIHAHSKTKDSFDEIPGKLPVSINTSACRKLDWNLSAWPWELLIRGLELFKAVAKAF